MPLSPGTRLGPYEIVAAMLTMAVAGSAPHAAGPSRQASRETPASASALLSAAFGEFAKAGGAYAQLHHRYLGVTQPAPDSSSCAVWPGGNVGVRTLRLGFVAEVPLHTLDASGHHVGFEADLAAELVRRINAHYSNARVTLEWVPVNVTLPVGPAKNITEFSALAAGLRARTFDVAFSSVVPVPAADVAYLCPTLTMFPGVAYTGRDGFDVSSIHDRPSLVAFLVAHPGMTFVHGMGLAVYESLAVDVAKAGGSILGVVDRDAPLPDGGHSGPVEAASRRRGAGHAARRQSPPRCPAEGHVRVEVESPPCRAWPFSSPARSC